MSAREKETWRIIALVGPSGNRYKVLWNKQLNKIAFSQLIFGEAELHEVSLAEANTEQLEIKSRDDVALIATKYFKANALNLIGVSV